MELSFLELAKRDVINVADGKCLGRITDLALCFPKGVMTGIVVPGKRVNCFTRIFCRTEIFISVNQIVKIGNDVILVNIRPNESCAPNVGINIHKEGHDCEPSKCPPSKCPPQRPPHPPNCEELFGEEGRGEYPDDYQNL